MTERTVPVKVWDGWVRLFHWASAASVVVSYVSAKAEAWNLHYFSGYTLLTLVLFRFAWGFVGSSNARFRAFLRGPGAALRHLARLKRVEPDTEITHNPAGGWMVVLLLGLLLVQAGSGLFANHDPGFTYSQHGPLANAVSEATSERLTTLHVTLVNWLLAAVAVHVVAIIAYRLLKGQNLIVPMVTGIKKLPESAARRPRHASPILGAALLAAAALAVSAITRLG